jgi:hypothetical protein
MPPIYNQTLTNVLPGLGGEPGQAVLAAALDSTSDALTATAAGTQTTSLLIISRLNHLTTVASGAGVRLPPAIAGMVVKINNAGANAVNVFPSSLAQGSLVAGGDAINALSAGTAYSQAVGSQSYSCYTTGTWITPS